MNPKLEEEARKLSEKKGLPFEYVKQMLEFAERAEDNSIDFPEPLKLRLISETTALFWAKIAEEKFQQIMPDLGIPFPSVHLNCKQLLSYKEKYCQKHRLSSHGRTAGFYHGVYSR